MNKKLKEGILRIEQLLGSKFSDISRRMETLDFFKIYLEKELKFPIEVRGREDFSWEEFYVMGPGDKREYETLKLTRASYTDKMRMTRLSVQCDEDYGLFAHFVRIADKKRFELPLADFKAVNQKTDEARMLEDYSIWFVNY